MRLDAKQCQVLLTDSIIIHYVYIVKYLCYNLFMPQKPKFELQPLLDTESVGSRIAYFRKKRGFTQIELAKLIGIDNVLVSHYERNRLRLNNDMIVRFALALKVSADELLGLKKNKTAMPEIGLRFVKRLLIIETFPEVQKKRILRNLDDAIAAYPKSKNY